MVTLYEDYLRNAVGYSRFGVVVLPASITLDIANYIERGRTKVNVVDVLQILADCIEVTEVDESDTAMVNYRKARTQIMKLGGKDGKTERER